MMNDYSNKAMNSNVTVGHFKKPHKPADVCKCCGNSDERTIAGMDWCKRCVEKTLDTTYTHKSAA